MLIQTGDKAEYRHDFLLNYLHSFRQRDAELLSLIILSYYFTMKQRLFLIIFLKLMNH